MFKSLAAYHNFKPTLSVHLRAPEFPELEGSLWFVTRLWDMAVNKGLYDVRGQLYEQAAFETYSEHHEPSQRSSSISWNFIFEHVITVFYK